ncbi:MAG: hypothetical protein CMF46_05960 [Legionellales bacterium]|nr:hypothetical protein [Legionellales bacterium]
MRLFNKNLGTEFAVIAEIGVNHEGSLTKALKLMELAAEGGADAVKFQSYTPQRYISSLDEAKLARVSKFALSEKDHEVLHKHARELGVHFFSTAVSEDWVPIIARYSDVLKIASGDLDFKQVITAGVRACKTVLLSVGGGSMEEIDRAVGWIKDEIGGQALCDRLILMHCVSAYPAPVEEANLKNIALLRDRFGVFVGYSNHVVGINACLAAVACGANVIEMHFTDNKVGRDFRDHALSADQEDLRSFIAAAKEIKSAVGLPGKVVQSSEISNVRAMRKGVVASTKLTKGHTLCATDLMYARPIVEYSSNEIGELIGRTLQENINQGMPILAKHLT